MSATEKKTKKNNKWIKKRHSFFQAAANIVLSPIEKIKYGAQFDRTNVPQDRQCLILYNHQTPFDQFFITALFKKSIFKKTIYYVATEDIFSLGFKSKLLKFTVAPIPIKKSVSDVRAVMNCLKIAKEGGSIAIAPEGNRTYSGRTENIKPAIVGLAKTLKLPVVIVKIAGGYGVEPRWSDKARKGKLTVSVDKIIEPEDFKNYSDDEFFKLIKSSLYVNEYAIKDVYKSKRQAEYIERLVYVCPDCGITNFVSSGNVCKCLTCGKEIEFTEDKSLHGKNCEFKFKNVGEWYDYQENFINNLDLSVFGEDKIFSDTVKFDKVIVYKNKENVFKTAEFCAFSDRFEVETENEKFSYNFDDIKAVAICGRNKLQFYHLDEIFQVKGDKRFNAVKYMHIYYHAKNVKGGENNEFLGL